MAINFNWNEKEKELRAEAIKLNEGFYAAKIESASLTKRDIGGVFYDAALIQVKVISPEAYAGKVVSKYYILDTNYRAKNVVKFNVKEVDSLLLNFGQKYHDQKSLTLALFELEQKQVTLGVKKTAKTDGSDGFYTNYRIFVGEKQESKQLQNEGIKKTVINSPQISKTVQKEQTKEQDDDEFSLPFNFEEF